MLPSLLLRRVAKFGKHDCQTVNKEKTDKIHSRRISVIREDSKEDYEDDLRFSDRVENKNIFEKRIQSAGRKNKQEEKGRAYKTKGKDEAIRNSSIENVLRIHSKSSDRLSPASTAIDSGQRSDCATDSNQTLSEKLKQTKMPDKEKQNCFLAEETPSRNISREFRSRYSEGDLLRPAIKKSMNCHQRASTGNKKRRNSTVTFQELKFSQSEDKPTIQCRGRRHAICEELEKLTFFAGLSLRQWRKVILTNETLQNYEIRW